MDDDFDIQVFDVETRVAMRRSRIFADSGEVLRTRAVVDIETSCYGSPSYKVPQKCALATEARRMIVRRC